VAARRDDPNAFTTNARSGVPRYYYWGKAYDFGGDVVFWPQGSGGPLTFAYHRIPPDPTSAVEAWSGQYSEYHDLIAMHAAFHLMPQGGPTAAGSGVFMQRFEQRRDEFRAALSSQSRGRPTPRATGPNWRTRWNR